MASALLLPLSESVAVSQTVPPLCGSRATSAPPTTYKHVVWIWFENETYGAIIGPSGSTAYANAPYINGTVVRQCGLARNYHNVTHWSLPNYLATVAGTPGVAPRVECTPSACPQSAATIFSQLNGSGRSWRSYIESMQSNCARTSTSVYHTDHNPAVYYPAIRASCATSDVPLGTTTSGALHTALATDTLPAFAFIVPNQCHDMHACSIKSGDSWLATWVKLITNGAGYQAGNTAVFVTWDEGEPGRSNACTTNTTDIGCHVAALVITPYTRPGAKSATLYSHYSLLQTAETLLNLPHLAHAADASTYSMRSGFHL